ncbi:MAG: SpoIIE family protein phosphatase [Candidatus Eisenbacteria bacterium]|nr:SpoIIE family protein phosphatase [Candidatus Eisenbacteria bacterium]
MMILRGAIGAIPIEHPLGIGEHSVGRSAESALKLGDPSVSREHAKIVVSDAMIEVVDLGSRNGTLINGVKLTPQYSVKARHGDELRFGAVTLRMIDPSASPGSAGLNQSGQLHGLRSDATHIPRLSTAEGIEASVRLSWDSLGDKLDPALRRDRDLFRVLTEAGALLVAQRPLEEIFEAALDLIERVVPGKRVLLLLGGEGEELPSVQAARPRGTAEDRLMLSRTLLSTVLDKREALLVVDAQLDPNLRDQQSIMMQGIHSALAAPLFDNEQVIGLVYSDTDNPLLRFDQDMLRALTVLANLIAIKITNTRLLETEREKQRMEQELATAARIQQSLLPQQLPEIPGYELYARQLSCFECAGDLYEADRLEQRYALVLGDVSGKGMGAAMLMSHIMACLHLLHDEGLEPLPLVERLHRQVFRSSRPSDFVTLFYGQLDPEAQTLHYVNGGHCPGLLFRGDGTETELPPTGLPVGMILNRGYEAASTQLAPGDLLCVYSDGIPEAFLGEDDYGEERLKESIRKRRTVPLSELADGILEDLRAYLGEVEAGDDITLLLLRRVS